MDMNLQTETGQTIYKLNMMTFWRMTAKDDEKLSSIYKLNK